MDICRCIGDGDVHASCNSLTIVEKVALFCRSLTLNARLADYIDVTRCIHLYSRIKLTFNGRKKKE